ncbi:MAG: phosphatidate cytidylyltransferase [Weeksellaceae bacterium]|nr:phosphatidate cytidylyltransferase [Weeksellaceae bacterium]
MSKNLLLRAVFGFIYVALIWFATLYDPYVFIGIFVALCGLGIWELSRLLKFENKLFLLATVAVAGYILWVYGSRFYYGTAQYTLHLEHVLPVALFLVALVLIFKRPMELAYDSSKIIFINVYLVLPFALTFALLRKFEIDNFQVLNPVFFTFILIWVSDTFAYIIGRIFGTKKLSAISEKKTVEGLIGGMFFTIVAGVILHFNFPGVRGNWMIIAALVAFAAPIGDLAESKLKRVFGVKDSGNIIPGHGGILDRLDSYLVTIVVVYFYFLFA